MIELTNYASKIFFNDTNNSYFITTYIDYDEVFETEHIINYINEITTNNSRLTNIIVKMDNSFFLDDIKLLNINDYYTIEYTSCDNFDNYINTMLNDEITTQLKWKMLWCIDKESNKTRFYFKIHHAYVDGYQLIKILMPQMNENKRYVIPQIKRKPDLFETIYHYIIGTIVLIYINIRFLLNICYNLITKVDNKKPQTKTDFIICKEFNFQEIKTFTKKNNITINDFCYSLMIKTDKLYTNKERLLSMSSPINVSRSSQNTNICPVFNLVSNAYDNNTLFKIIHDTFNAYKYSLFIPLFSSFINNIAPFVHIDMVSKGYDIFTENTDYVYSNMIGPSFDGLNVKVSNICFLSSAKNKEIKYNIISCNNEKINIICSFKNGVIEDKARFEKCIYDAYQSLITTY